MTEGEHRSEHDGSIKYHSGLYCLLNKENMSLIGIRKHWYSAVTSFNLLTLYNHFLILTCLPFLVTATWYDKLHVTKYCPTIYIITWTDCCGSYDWNVEVNVTLSMLRLHKLGWHEQNKFKLIQCIRIGGLLFIYCGWCYLSQYHRIL